MSLQANSPFPPETDIPTDIIRQGLLRTSVLLMGVSVLNILAAFLRERTLANYFGHTVNSDALFRVLTVPIFFYTVLDCVFQSCVIPEITRLKARYNPDELSGLLGSFAASALLLLTVVAGLLLLFRDPLLRFLDPRWQGPDAELPSRLALYVWPSIVLIGLATFGIHVVNSLGSHFLAALSLLPRALLICLTVLLLHRTLGVVAGAIGFTFGVAGQLVPVSVGLAKHRLRLGVRQHGVQKEARGILRFLAVPAAGIVLLYLFYPIEGAISSYCPVGLMTNLHYGRRICQILTLLFAASVGVVTHTRASEAWGAGRKDEAIGRLTEALRLALLLLGPAATLALLTRVPFLNLVLLGGEFDESGVRITAELQLFLFPAVSALILVNLLMSFFLTARKVWLHFAVNLCIFLATIILELFFVFSLNARTLGIAAGWSAAAVLALPLVLLLFQTKIAPLPLKDMGNHLLKVGISCAVAAGPGVLILRWIPPQNRRDSLILLPLIALVFLAVFTGAACLLRVDGIDRILRGLTTLWGRKQRK